MKRARSRDGVGLTVLLLSAILSTAVTHAALSAGLRQVSESGFACSTTSRAVAARAAADGSDRGLSASSRSLLGKRGEVVGRVLNARTANGSPIAIDLPVESFVGEATDDLVVYTKHTAAAGSQVRALDLVSGCDALLAAPPEIVRSAVLDADARFLYFHSVKKSGRADAGVVRVDLATGESAQAVAALHPNERLGPLFGTDLHWSADGSALAVQSCGMSECLTRVLDVASGNVATLNRPDQGPFIALSREHLVTYAACGGLPCDVLSADLATGEVTLLAAEALGVKTASTAGSVVIDIQTATGVVEVQQ